MKLMKIVINNDRSAITAAPYHFCRVTKYLPEMTYLKYIRV